MRLACLNISQFFFGGRDISLEAVLVDFKVAVNIASSFFFRCLGSKLFCSVWCDEPFFGRWDIHDVSLHCFWIEYPMWTPVAAFGRSSNNWWLSLLILVIVKLFGWAWSDISNFLIYNVLGEIMNLIGSINIGNLNFGSSWDNVFLGWFIAPLISRGTATGYSSWGPLSMALERLLAKRRWREQGKAKLLREAEIFLLAMSSLKEDWRSISRSLT